MAKKDRNQLLDEHQEWVDHMYNPGYWLNRIGYVQRGHWGWARQHHRLAGGLGALIFSGALATVFVNHAQEGLSLNPATWRLLSNASLLENLATLGFMLVFILLFVASLLLFFRKPGQGTPK